MVASACKRSATGLASAGAALAIGLGVAGAAHADVGVSLRVGDGNGNGSTGGVVFLEDNGGSFNVTVAALFGWRIVEVHIDVDTDNTCANVPQTGNGNPKVGKFEYHEDYDLASAPTQSITTIPDSAYDGDADDIICLAVHAVVFDPAAAADLPTAFELSAEGAWGVDETAPMQFADDRNWATYFTIDVENELNSNN